MTPTRRQFLAGAGTLATVGLAGCTAFGSDPIPPTEIESWLADTENHDGIHDRTGQERVDVEVGADRGLHFEPAAVLVDTDTLLRWEWTGRGGHHDVVEVDGAFTSEMTDDVGYTFEHTFSTPGTFLYSCRPHEAVGMKGAVVVQE